MTSENIQKLREIDRHLIDPDLSAKIFEHLPDAVVVVDTQGRIRLVNRQAELLFGYVRTELFDQPVEMLIPAPLRERHASHRDEFAIDPHTRPMGTGMVLNGLAKDGSEFAAEINLSPLMTGEGLLVMAVVRRKRDG